MCERRGYDPYQSDCSVVSQEYPSAFSQSMRSGVLDQMIQFRFILYIYIP